MFDTMTVTKVGGAFCGALLAFLLLNWLADGIYSSEGRHGEHAEAAYVIEVEGAGDYLPKYSGNLDIMTATACAVGEMYAEKLLSA